MSKYEILSVALSGLSFFASFTAVFLAGLSLKTNKKMFRRQGVIDLHMAWQGISEIDPSNPVVPDVVKAVNALNLTSALWHHDVLEKVILYQSYWRPFKELYDTIFKIESPLSGKRHNGRDLLTADIRKAYNDMDNFELNNITQSRV